MTDIRNYEDLKVWQKAITLADMIYDATESFPRGELFGLTNQMRRAVVSIASNIAEGSTRGTRKDCGYFIGLSRGSLAELQTQLIIARNRKFLIHAAYEALHHETIVLSKMLMGLFLSLKQEKELLSTNHEALSTL